MYQLVIVDDEVKIRNFLSDVIDWKSLGFEVASLFSDGDEVITYIDNHHVDCILSDIKMINVSGIELSKYVYLHHPYIKMVMLSGYQDFEYVRECFKYNVSDYLLKPTNIDELISTFQRINSQLNEVRDTNYFISCFRSDFFKNLICGKINNLSETEEILKKLDQHININSSCCIVTFLLKNNTEAEKKYLKHGKEASHFVFQNLALDINSEVYPFFVSIENQLATYIIFSSKSTEAAVFQKRIATISKNMKDILCTDIETIEHKMFSCVKNLFEASANHNDKELKIKDAVNLGNLLSKYIHEIFIAINSGNISEIKRCFTELQNEYADEHCSVIKNYIEFITLYVIKEYEKNYRAQQLEAFTTEFLATLHAQNTKISIYRCTILGYEKLVETVNSNSTAKIILETCDYIVNNCEKDLSLSFIADKAHFDPKYFSKIFKQITGSTYIDFLISSRLDKAKTLLVETNIKIQDISSHVGYSNTRFFSKQFKAKFGIVPAEYRKKFKKD